MPYPLPDDETARLSSLRELAILDTAPEQMYDDVVALAAAICGTSIAMINFVDADRQWGKALVGLETSEATREASFCARAILSEEVLVVPDTQADPLWAGNAQVTGHPHLRFYAGAPIVGDDGHAVGTVCVADNTPRTLDPTQLDALRALARQTAAHLELRRRTAELGRLNDDLRRMAVEDALTGLPNRTLLFDRIGLALAQRERSGQDVGVLFCDLDGFKGINDRFGHEAGDIVLRTVADRLVASARAVDTVARLAGDEFVVVCPDLHSERGLATVAQRLRDAIARPVAVDGAMVTPEASIGGALAAAGDDAISVLRRADQSMYAAKRARAAAVAA